MFYMFIVKIENIGWYKQDIIIIHSQLTQCLSLSSFTFFFYISFTPLSSIFFFLFYL